MVGEGHQAAGVHFGAQRAGGIGHEQHFAAEQLHGAHGRRHHAGAIAFVEMAAALHAHYRHTGQGAEHQLARVAVHGADREAGQLVEADRYCVNHLLGQHAKARTENHRDARLESRFTGADNVGGFKWGVAQH
jgi:hypothetical protein